MSDNNQVNSLPKVAIFVDVQNIYYTTRDAFKKPFNYRKFWQSMELQYDIVQANAYAIKRQKDDQIKFQDALRHIGFEVKLKPFIQREDGSSKGDWDVGLTIDLLETAIAGGLDKIILLSGDGDFDMLLTRVQDHYKISTQVYSVETLTADSLIATTDKFSPITPHFLMP